MVGQPGSLALRPISHCTGVAVKVSSAGLCLMMLTGIFAVLILIRTSTSIETVGSAVDANDPDLSAFRDHGGKLIVYHGWSDPDISPLASIDYFSRVVDLAASEADVTSREQAESVTKDYFRLFMAPGMGHCAGGPGLSLIHI